MKRLLYFLIVLLVASCKQRYESPVKPTVTGYLVVDGVVNSGPGAASLTLSRTIKFDGKNIVYEKGAAVNIQGEDSSSRSFAESTAGIYNATNLNLNNAIKYRLRITTSNGSRYVSDFVPVKNNPPIDSISWKRENDGLQLYVSTHDPQNNTHYYQWYYDETWQIQSSFYSVLKYQKVRDNISVVYKDSITYSYDPSIINCWQFYNALSIYLGSTAKLSQDIIYLPIAFVPGRSEKLGVLYSINIRQYAWTKEGYEFMDKMRRNTESTGSVFDPQPSELKGNLRNVADAAEPVIGFFNICPVQAKRIFIRNSELPGWGYDPGCLSLTIENISDSIMMKGLGLYPVAPVDQGPFGRIITFQAATPNCVDCTLKGTNKKPAYWP